MKTTTFKFAVVLAVSAVLCGQLCAQEDIESLKKKITRLSDDMTQAWIKGDIDRLFSHYTDEAISLPNYEPMIRGKVALRDHEKRMRDAGLKAHSMKSTIVDLWVLGDSICEIGKYEITLTIPGMTEPVSDTGKYVTIWQRQPDGSFKVRLETWNTDSNPFIGQLSGAAPAQPEPQKLATLSGALEKDGVDGKTAYLKLVDQGAPPSAQAIYSASTTFKGKTAKYAIANIKSGDYTAWIFIDANGNAQMLPAATPDSGDHVATFAVTIQGDTKQDVSGWMQF